MSSVNQVGTSISGSLTDCLQDWKPFFPLRLESRSFRMFTIPSTNEWQSEQEQFLTDKLKQLNQTSGCHLAFRTPTSDPQKAQSDSLKFRNVETVLTLVGELVNSGHFGPFSIFHKGDLSGLEDLKKMYEAENSYQTFPYELNPVAVSLDEGWLELKFSPLYYLFPTSTILSETHQSERVLDPSLVKEIEAKNNDEASRTGRKLDLSRNQVAVRNTLHLNAVTALLNSSETKNVLSSLEIEQLGKYFGEVKLVTYEELVNDLTTLTLQVKADLAEKPYSIIFNTEKSSQWMAELGVPILGKSPENYLGYYTDTGGAGYLQNKIDNTIKDYILFDDFAYSGDQIYTSILRTLRCQLPEGATLHVVVPYVSKKAKRRWDIFLDMSDKNIQDDKQRHLRILKTNKSFREANAALKVMYDKEAKNEFKNTYSKFRAYAKEKLNLELPESPRLDKTSAICEWKIADRQSIDEGFFWSTARENGKPIYKVSSVMTAANNTASAESILLEKLSLLWKTQVKWN